MVPAVLPFFHIFGISALILTAIMNGSKIVSLKKFNPEKYLSIIENEKVIHFSKLLYKHVNIVVY